MSCAQAGLDTIVIKKEEALLAPLVLVLSGIRAVFEVIRGYRVISVFPW